MSNQKIFGDYQTPLALCRRVIDVVVGLGVGPTNVVEPTAGKGAFLQAASDRWGSCVKYSGYELNKEYVESARRLLGSRNIDIHQGDFFSQDWRSIVAEPKAARTLVIGNPPWVTNSEIGALGGSNLPNKSNRVGLRGFEARTGKSNFDIAEWMLIRMLEVLPSNGSLAMLCKTATARKVLRHFWRNGIGLRKASLFRFDAKAEFGVSVDACLLFVTGERTSERIATVYSNLDLNAPTTSFGFVNDNLVSSIDDFLSHRDLDGGSSLYTWRSGIKHDASKVMEFTRSDCGELVNGFGEEVRLEADCLFPLLKSSDLGNGRIVPRKAVLVTQTHTGANTGEIESRAPLTWRYLKKHQARLDSRKSSIYVGRARFSIFGVGPYSFTPWKLAISGLYKDLVFTVIGPHEGKPIMLDDTCYFISCKSEEEALFLCELITTQPALSFLRSLVFRDAKRPVTIDVLSRLSFSALANRLGKLDRLNQYADFPQRGRSDELQTSLVLEQRHEYAHA